MEKKIISPLQRQDIQVYLKRDAMLAKLAVDLMKIHDNFISKVEEYKDYVKKHDEIIKNKIGPKGDNPSEDDLVALMTPIIESIVPTNEDFIQAIELIVTKAKDKLTLSPDEIKSLIDSMRDSLKKEVMPTTADMMAIIKKLMPKVDIDRIATVAATKVKIKVLPPKDVDFSALVAYIKSLPEDKKLSTKDIANFDFIIQELRNEMRRLHGGKMRGGGDTVSAGTGIVITRNSNGDKVLSATGTAGAWSTPAEIPLADGTRFIYTVGSTKPTDVIADGLLYYETIHWTYAANQITFINNAPTQYVRYR